MAEHLRIEEAESEPIVLDIGAGSRVYSIPFALRSPKVRITAVDLPEVLEVTQRIAERYGIGDRLKRATWQRSILAPDIASQR